MLFKKFQRGVSFAAQLLSEIGFFKLSMRKMKRLKIVFKNLSNYQIL